MCRKHELTQFELEVASQDLISKKQQREELATGVHYSVDQGYATLLDSFSPSLAFTGISLFPQIVRTFSLKGMTNKLFGQEAPEQREARLKLLEELITEGEETVKEKTVECE